MPYETTYAEPRSLEPIDLAPGPNDAPRTNYGQNPNTSGTLTPYGVGNPTGNPNQGTGLSSNVIDAEWSSAGSSSLDADWERQTRINPSNGRREWRGTGYEDWRYQDAGNAIDNYDLPSSQPVQRRRQWARDLERAGAAISGIEYGVDVYARTGSLTQAGPAAVGAALGTFYGGTLGAQAAVAAQGPGAAEPTSSGIGATLGAAAGAALGRELGGTLGQGLGAGFENFLDWLNGEDVPENNPVPFDEGGQYDPDYPGGFEGGQDAVLYYIEGTFTVELGNADGSTLGSLGGEYGEVGIGRYFENLAQEWTDFGTRQFSGTAFGPLTGFKQLANSFTKAPIMILSNPDGSRYVQGFTVPGGAPQPPGTLDLAIVSVVVTILERVDGLPDNSPNNPDFENPVRTPSARPIGGNPPWVTPFPDLPTINLPDFGNPTLPDNPFQPIAPPIDLPDGLPSIPNPFGGTPTGNPEPYKPPFSRPGSGGGTGAGTGTETGSETPDCNVCGKLDELISYFSSDTAITSSLLPCDDGDSTIQIESNGTGISGIADNQQKLLDVLTEIWNRVKCEQDMYASIPDSHTFRAPTIKPQLQVQYKQQGEKSGSRWHITIPHFDESLRDAISLPAYTKGNYRCVLELADNSRIVVNAISEIEGRGILSACLNYVESEYRTPASSARITLIPSRDFREVRVEPCYAKYFSGTLEEPPKWTRKL